MLNFSDNSKLDDTNLKFNKLLRICLILGIITASAFIVYYILNPEPGYCNFGILNSNGKAENYPTSARVGENIEFYVTVENYLNRDLKFKVRILRGNEFTDLGSTGSINAIFLYSTQPVTLSHDELWISEKLKVSFPKARENQQIIVELWEITENDDEVFKNILYLRLDIGS